MRRMTRPFCLLVWDGTILEPRRQPTIDRHDLAGDVAVLLAREKSNRVGNLTRLRRTAQGQSTLTNVDIRKWLGVEFVLPINQRHQSRDKTRGDRVQEP